MSNLVVGKNRRSTSYSVSFPTMPSLNSNPIRVDLIQKQNHHDVLVLEFPSTSPTWVDNLNTGTPVRFTWKQGHRTGDWVGYVSFVSAEVVAQRKKVMQIHCVGTGFPLKESATRVFTNTTIPEAVEAVVKEFGLGFDGENHPHRFDQLVISGESYWEWIQEQAKRIGYAVVIDGVKMTFKPMDRLIDHSVYDTPVLAMFNSDIPSDVMSEDRTLDYFRVTKGDYVESNLDLRSIKSVAGVDPVTKKAIFSDSSPDKVGRNLRESSSDVLFSQHRTDRVPLSHRPA